MTTAAPNYRLYENHHWVNYCNGWLCAQCGKTVTATNEHQPCVVSLSRDADALESLLRLRRNVTRRPPNVTGLSRRVLVSMGLL